MPSASYLFIAGVVPTATDWAPSSVPPPSSGSSGDSRFPVSSGEGSAASRHFTGPLHEDRPDRCMSHYGRQSDVVTLWDIDDAKLPNPNRNPSALPLDHVLVNIKAAPTILLVDTAGMEFNVYGNGKMSMEYKEALLDAPGLSFYIVDKEKQAANRRLIKDLQRWAIEHPPPAYVFLISGDGDFFEPLAVLVSRGYSLLLAYSEMCDSRLLELATYALPFHNLVCDVAVDASANDVDSVIEGEPCADGAVAASAGDSFADVGASANVFAEGVSGATVDDAEEEFLAIGLADSLFS